jgi:hypothetical protein
MVADRRVVRAVDLHTVQRSGDDGLIEM